MVSPIWITDGWGHVDGLVNIVWGFPMITIINILIAEEHSGYASNYRLLGSSATNMLRTMVDLYRATGRYRFMIDDFRTIFGPWRQVVALFFELESREFGVVVGGNVGAEFLMSVDNVRKIRHAT